MAKKEFEPFVKVNPGDLISDDLWHVMQIRVREGIEDRVIEALANVEKAVTAESALESERFGGKTFKELKDEILEDVRKLIPNYTGYKRFFKLLTVGEQTEIQHNLQEFPLVDVYQLDYFQVACAEDEDKFAAHVNFYLYHSSEKKIRFKPADAPDAPESFITVEIEPHRGSQPCYKIPFAEMLERYEADYTPNSTLGELETEFWKKFFAAPNDEFDDEQYCHSPWYERCCREEKTVRQLKSSGDWNDLWFQMRPRQTINYPEAITGTGQTAADNTPAPTQIQVEHFDFNTLGLTLLQAPPFEVPGRPVANREQEPALNELKVMVLLKV